MNKKICRMCVIGLILASPAACSAAITIADAVVGAGDGKYVMMEYGGSFDLTFGGSLRDQGPDIILSFEKLDNPDPEVGYGIQVQFLPNGLPYDFTETDFRGLTLTVPGALAGGKWSGVRIRAGSSNQPMYLDAVQVDADGSYGPYVVTNVQPTVTVLIDDPAVLIGEMIQTVEGFNLQQGIESSLDGKLQAAFNALNDANVHNNAAAMNSLEIFKEFCDDQFAKGKITPEQVAELKGQAQKIITILLAPTS